ncbi:carbohydrate-binding protein [Pontibacter sp. G13]|uniref:carbohydrate-binding protein n=1 Tax=Pontibacter sp. G13 TaxID=3074898 RepID=UPI00288AA4C4|nr:carbohydrate-binding protein [Pontibacter sp. G13]WNJ18798.1 carbohydrate-binding protein [Pontibacter sp. G13]
MKKLWLLLLGCMCLQPLSAQVETYSYPNAIVNGNDSEVKKSTLYDVKVTQGSTTKTCYVMYDKNQGINVNNNLALNPDNHWTNFSTNSAVTIEISRIDGGNITSADVYPLKKGYTASVSNGKATINLPAGANKLQLWVDINGTSLDMDPLFIFVDPLETGVPSKTASNVTLIETTDNIATVISKLNDNKEYAYFEEGIHKWGNVTGENYDGYQLPLKSNKKIYIPGGAFVIGSFQANTNDGWTVFGRGVISGAGLDILPTATYIPWSAIHNTGGTGMKIEGIVTNCPPHFALTVRGTVDIDNVKMMSWWHSTDGTITGDNSTVNNCFFKVMDDAIKAYGNNCTHLNNTVFHQVNGAVVQFAWSGQNGDDNVFEDIYVINSIYKSLNGPSNTAVINLVDHKNGEIIENNSFDGIYIENGCHRLLGLNPSTGTHRNFTIENVELNSGKNPTPQKAESYLSGGGSFSNFDIINLKIDGNQITGLSTSSDQPSNGLWWFTGQSAAISISGGSGGGGGTPSDLTDLSATVTNCSTVSLTWTDTDGETAYRIRRKLPSASAYTNLTDVAAGSTSYTDNSVSENTDYVYMVRPVVNGTAVATSNTPTASVGACSGGGGGSPVDLTDVALSAPTCNAVVVTWTDGPGETAYRIRRKVTGGATFTTLGDVAADAETYTDNSVVAGTNYTYQVRPVVSGTAVANSNQPSIAVPACGTGAPIPGRLEAEDYDSQSGIQTENTTDTGGGQNIGFIQNGDYIEFDVSVASTGSYDIDFRVATNTSGGTIQLKQGSTILATRTVSNTGGWQSWSTVSTTANLTAGNYTFRFEFVGGSGFLFNLNWIDFSTNSGSRKAQALDQPQWVLFPNPVTDFLQIEGIEFGDDVLVQIYNLSGQVVLSLPAAHKLDVDQLEAGVYLLRVEGMTAKFFKQ